MNLEPVIARLKAAKLAGAVEEIDALAQLDTNPPQFLPALYAVNDDDRGAAPRKIVDAGIHDQEIDCDFQIAAIVPADGAQRGGGAKAMRELRDAIEKLFTGWVHPEAEGRSTAFVRYQLIRASAGRLAFAVRFRTVRRVRVPITGGAE